jgi:hypothetical protein
MFEHFTSVACECSQPLLFTPQKFTSKGGNADIFSLCSVFLKNSEFFLEKCQKFVKLRLGRSLRAEILNEHLNYEVFNDSKILRFWILAVDFSGQIGLFTRLQYVES